MCNNAEVVRAESLVRGSYRRGDRASAKAFRYRAAVWHMGRLGAGLCVHDDDQNSSSSLLVPPERPGAMISSALTYRWTS
jgi:hypothetical protein